MYELKSKIWICQENEHENFQRERERETSVKKEYYRNIEQTEENPHCERGLERIATTSGPVRVYSVRNAFLRFVSVMSKSMENKTKQNKKKKKKEKNLTEILLIHISQCANSQ